MLVNGKEKRGNISTWKEVLFLVKEVSLFVVEKNGSSSKRGNKKRGSEENNPALSVETFANRWHCVDLLAGLVQTHTGGCDRMKLSK